MARSKRPIAFPAGPQRQPIRRRVSDQPPEAVTGDLNEPPPVSGEVHADTSSSLQASPNKTTESVAQVVEEETLTAEEEERKLEEEYQLRLSAIKKKKEDAERKKREEEERKKREEEERKKREEEERKKREEEDRIQREEEERQKKETEELKKKEQEKEEAEKASPPRDNVEAMQPDPSDEPGSKRKLRSKPTPSKSSSKTTPKKRQGKGKAIAPSSSTSSMEGDSEKAPSETPSDNPHKTTVGTAHAPTGVPKQFTNQGAAAHYECIASQKLNMERGFDLDFVNANPFIKKRVDELDWKVITDPTRKANASLVREFYAEASQVKDPVVKVRGKIVKYTPSSINSLLGRPVAETCAFAQFLKKMTEADEKKILKEIAAEGKDWGKDGQRKCLPAAALTTEAAIWFQFVRSSVSPTTHDTTLSMHKCALLYCLLTGRRVNLGTIMHAAIHQARTRKKVILPLPCLVTALLINAGVPTSAEDQWLVSSSPISEQTLKRMGRRGEKELESALPKQPNVMIAEEHQVGTSTPTVGKATASTSAQHDASTRLESTLQEVLRTLKKLTYRIDIMEATQRYQDQAEVKFWTYARDRDNVINQILIQTDPEIAHVLPAFPDEICPGVESEQEGYDSEFSAATTPSGSHDE